LQGSQSAPDMKRVLHHRGEHSFGTVKGFDHLPGELYVPRAGWTESFSSPLKHREADPDAEKWLAASGEQAYKASMKQHIRHGVLGQVRDREAAMQTMKAGDMELLARSSIDVARLAKEKDEAKVRHKERAKVFREGLCDQMAHKEQVTRNLQAQNVYEGAEIKKRTTQQLVQDLAKADTRKDDLRREMLSAVSEARALKAQRREDQQRENAELRENLRATLNEEGSRFLEQQQRVKAAMASQEAFYKRYSSTTGAEQQERLDKEARRHDKDEKQHQRRMDMHYAQREMARERQKQRMVEALASQVESKSKRGPTKHMQQELELEALGDCLRQGREAELHKQRCKRAEELENQAALVAQMHERQQRQKAENPHARPTPRLSTMSVTPALLASAEGWRTGARSAMPDITQNLDAARHLSKPLGRPEGPQPWQDIAASLGPGGVVGIFGGEGATRAVLMSTGGPGRLMSKTAELADRDRQLQRPWHEGVTPDELKAARRVAAKRAKAAAADKAVAA